MDCLTSQSSKAYKYRAIDAHLHPTIQNGIIGRIWMSRFDTFRDRLELSFDVRESTNEETQSQKIAATKRFISYVAQSQTTITNAMSGNPIDMKKIMDAEWNRISSNLLAERALRLDSINVTDFLTDLKKQALCACFCEDGTVGSMWEHYAQDHTGVCLEYDDYYDYSLYLPNLNMPRLVTYYDGPVLLSAVDVWEAVWFLDYAQRWVASPNSHWSVNSPAIKVIEDVFLKKTQAYAYEREFRAIQPGTNPGYHSWPGLKLSGIIFGVDCKPDDVAAITECYSTKVKFSKITTNTRGRTLEIVNL